MFAGVLDVCGSLCVHHYIHFVQVNNVTWLHHLFLSFKVNRSVYIANRTYRLCERRKKYQYKKACLSALNHLNKIVAITILHNNYNNIY